MNSRIETQISATNPANITVLGNGYSTAPTNITLPFASSTEPERYEGMLVRFNQTLYVTEHYQLGRFGQVVLSSSDRLYQPTHLFAPGSTQMFALQAANALNQIILDDSNQSQNPDPIVFGRGGNPLSASNTLRGGDTATNLTGVLTYTWGREQRQPECPPHSAGDFDGRRRPELRGRQSAPNQRACSLWHAACGFDEPAELLQYFWRRQL